MEKYISEQIQAKITVVKDWISGQSRYSSSALYCPLSHSINEQTIKTIFSNLDNGFIASGDYNTKWTFWDSRLIMLKKETYPKQK